MSRKPQPETPLYVKLPTPAVEKLDRAAAALGVHKKDLVEQLVTKYIASDIKPTVGSYSFRSYDPPEIMDEEEAARFLQVDAKTIVELAEAGKLPGKRLGKVWRFSRDALVAWLST